jgi:hypothetical protein
MLSQNKVAMKEQHNKMVIESKLTNIEEKYVNGVFADKDYDRLRDLLTNDSTHRIIKQNQDIKVRWEKAYNRSVGFIANTILAETLECLERVNFRDYFKKNFNHLEVESELTIGEISRYTDKLGDRVKDSVLKLKLEYIKIKNRPLTEGERIKIKRILIERQTLTVEHWIRIGNNCMDGLPPNLLAAYGIGRAISTCLSELPVTMAGLSIEATHMLSKMTLFTSHLRRYKDYDERNPGTIPSPPMMAAILETRSEMKGLDLPNENNVAHYQAVQHYYKNRFPGWAKIKSELTGVNPNLFDSEKNGLSTAMIINNTNTIKIIIDDEEKSFNQVVDELIGYRNHIMKLKDIKKQKTEKLKNLKAQQIESDALVGEIRKIDDVISATEAKINTTETKISKPDIFFELARLRAIEEESEKPAKLVKKYTSKTGEIKLYEETQKKSIVEKPKEKITVDLNTVFSLFVEEIREDTMGLENLGHKIYENKEPAKGEQDPMDIPPITKVMVATYLMLKRPEFFNPQLTGDHEKDKLLIHFALAYSGLTKIFFEFLSNEEKERFFNLRNPSDEKQKLFDTIINSPVLPKELKIYMCDVFEQNDTKIKLLGYDLGLMSDTSRHSGIIYLKDTTKNTTKVLQYEVIGLDGKLKNNTIPWNELGDTLPTDFPRNLPDIITQSKYKSKFLQALLDDTSRVGHTQVRLTLNEKLLKINGEPKAKKKPARSSSRRKSTPTRPRTKSTPPSQIQKEQKEQKEPKEPKEPKEKSKAKEALNLKLIIPTSDSDPNEQLISKELNKKDISPIKILDQSIPDTRQALPVVSALLQSEAIRDLLLAEAERYLIGENIKFIMLYLVFLENKTEDNYLVFSDYIRKQSLLNTSKPELEEHLKSDNPKEMKFPGLEKIANGLAKLYYENVQNVQVDRLLTRTQPPKGTEQTIQVAFPNLVKALEPHKQIELAQQRSHIKSTRCQTQKIQKEPKKRKNIFALWKLDPDSVPDQGVVEPSQSSKSRTRGATFSSPRSLVTEMTASEPYPNEKRQTEVYLSAERKPNAQKFLKWCIDNPRESELNHYFALGTTAETVIKAYENAVNAGEFSLKKQKGKKLLHLAIEALSVEDYKEEKKEEQQKWRGEQVESKPVVTEKSGDHEDSKSTGEPKIIGSLRVKNTITREGTLQRSPLTLFAGKKPGSIRGQRKNIDPDDLEDSKSSARSSARSSPSLARDSNIIKSGVVRKDLKSSPQLLRQTEVKSDVVKKALEEYEDRFGWSIRKKQ